MTDLGGVFSQLILEEQRSRPLEEEDDLEPLLLRSKRRKVTRADSARLKKQFAGSSTHRLSPEASRAMGAGNAAFVHRRHAEAISAFKEVIRLAPSAHEPYHSLGLIFEEMGDAEKAIGYFFLAAQLRPQDIELWKRLATMHQRSDNQRPDLVIYFMGRAIGASADGDRDYSWERIRFASQEAGLQRRVVGFLEQHIAAYPEDLEALNFLCDRYAAEATPSQYVLRSLKNIFDNLKDPSAIGAPHLSFLSLVAMPLAEYSVVADYVSRFGPLLAPIDADHFLASLPRGLALDFAIACAYSKAVDDQLFAAFLLTFLPDSKDACFLYASISFCNALVFSQYYEKAMKLWSIILCNASDEVVQSVFPYFSIADCYEGLGDLQEALSNRVQTLELPPNQWEVYFCNAARLKLVKGSSAFEGLLLAIQNEIYPAVASYDTPVFYSKGRQLQVRLLVEKWKLTRLESEKIATARFLIDELLRNAFLSRFGHASSIDDGSFSTGRLAGFDPTFQKQGERKSLLEMEDLGNLITSLLDGQPIARESAGYTEKQLSALHGLTVEEWFSFATDAISFFISLGSVEYAAEAEKIACASCNLNIFHRKRLFRLTLCFLGLAASLRSVGDCNRSDSFGGSSTLEWFIRSFPRSSKAFSLVYILAFENYDLLRVFLSTQKYSKFVKRHALSDGDAYSLMQYANCCLLNHNYSYAAYYYNRALALIRDRDRTLISNDQVLLLTCLAVARIHRCLSRRSHGKYFTLLLAIAEFIQIDLLKRTAFSAFNIARAFHQVGMFSFAVTYYELVLGMDDRRLRWLAAHNLRLIHMRGSNLVEIRRLNQLHCCSSGG